MVELSNEAKELLVNVQTHNQQLQNLIAQKQNLEIQLSEIDEALKEIQDKEEIYKEVAGILIKSDKNKIIEELKEAKEFAEIRKKQINQQEENLKKTLEEEQKKLAAYL
ncbi:MAG: hypothetical protein B6U88_01720 [Candidatus Aenigmarchaeota archaeon ex4484_56]|nr:MAG: hypothetical protein B6U88_01720 [Candidatus Aenigmarchaeota archaeon ex4484_56]